MEESEKGPRLVTLARGSYRVCGCGQVLICPGHCPQGAEAAPLRVNRRAERVWLCRCGGSSQWPRCDGSHNRRESCGFRA